MDQPFPSTTSFSLSENESDVNLSLSQIISGN